jgi:hypothetical protein
VVETADADCSNAVVAVLETADVVGVADCSNVVVAVLEAADAVGVADC